MQYRLQKDVAATAASDQLPAERGAHPLSGSVLARMEEAKTQQKLIQQQAAEAEIDHGTASDADQKAVSKVPNGATGLEHGLEYGDPYT
jgi:hypothetical protein